MTSNPHLTETTAAAGPLPTDAEVAAELAEPYALPADAVASFAAQSYVKLPGVLSPGTVVVG